MSIHATVLRATVQYEHTHQQHQTEQTADSRQQTADTESIPDDPESDFYGFFVPDGWLTSRLRPLRRKLSNYTVFV